jgi:3-deoxy-D-manno-octulosonic-acid transferase
MHILYSMTLSLWLVLSAPWWAVQMLRHGKYRAGLGERFGRVPERILAGHDARPCIWVHAVSVGEVLAVSGLITQLRQRFSGHRIVISTTTATGQKLARDRFGAENVFYFPLDFASAIRPYLRALQPELVVIAETEFWPNFLRLAHESGTRIAIVNARISDRSFPRYRALRSLVRRVLSGVDAFLAQSEEDARRLREIGAASDRVQVAGNLKFDVKPPAEPPLVSALRKSFGESGAGPVLVCGSTVEGEEPLVLEPFKRVLAGFPKAVLLLAPRHPERFAAVAELLASSGLPYLRRSQLGSEVSVQGGSVLLLDTIGELGAAYSLADVAFVGGSLAPRGGHNILEPALFGAAVLVGPHTENFRDIITLFAKADAVRVVADGDELGAVFTELLSDEQKRKALGARAAAVMKQHSGTTARTLNTLSSCVSTKEPATR